MTAQEDSDRLVEQARAYVGAPCGSLRVGRDPVNLPMVHHWCQALEDRNPAYLDEEFAVQTRGHLIAPPGMLQTWTMDAPRDADDPSPNDHVMRLLDQAGYTSVVAVNYEHEYLRELEHGERISVRSTTEDLSDEKKTALGVGRFTTTRSEYVTDDGELVGIGRMRILKFRPPQKNEGQKKDSGTRPAPPIGRDNAFFWEGVEAGELRIQKCNGCGVLRHPPGPMCDRCGSTDMGYVVASGRGVVYSHVTHHYPPLPGVELPHVVLLVELEEGVRVVSELASPAEVHVGMPVEVRFTKVPGGAVRPTFAGVGA